MDIKACDMAFLLDKGAKITIIINSSQHSLETLLMCNILENVVNSVNPIIGKPMCFSFIAIGYF